MAASETTSICRLIENLIRFLMVHGMCPGPTGMGVGKRISVKEGFVDHTATLMKEMFMIEVVSGRLRYRNR